MLNSRERESWRAASAAAPDRGGVAVAVFPGRARAGRRDACSPAAGAFGQAPLFHPFFCAQLDCNQLTALPTHQGEEEESEKQRLESLELSDAFFDQLPSSFVKCPGCKVPFEMLVDTSIMTPTTGVQELPRGATLDTLGAERHKSQCRFRCFNCTIEFCSGWCVSHPLCPAPLAHLPP